MHTSPNIKKASKLMSTKEKKKRATTYQVGFSKFQWLTWHLGHNAKGQLKINYMLTKLFAQKVDSNFREMKINCFILAWINISYFKNTWNFVWLPKNIWFFFIFLMFLVFVQIRKKKNLSHIASYHYYPLVKTHLYQGYFKTRNKTKMMNITHSLSS